MVISGPPCCYKYNDLLSVSNLGYTRIWIKGSEEEMMIPLRPRYAHGFEGQVWGWGEDARFKVQSEVRRSHSGRRRVKSYGKVKVKSGHG